MDHISNFLNFSLAGIDPPEEKQPTPSFTNTPADSTTHVPTESSNEKPEPALTDTAELKKRLYALKDEVLSIIRLLEGDVSLSTLSSPTDTAISAPKQTVSGEQIIEGVFNGEKMVGPDGQEYAVPPNYASKSRLVEGDHMKLTITMYGKFIYKQIGPTERKRIIGVLYFDEATQLWTVLHDGNTYKILTASATFYRGKPGDHVVILVPKDAKSSWGAVENIIAS
jgi:hypothetical protein